ncbi:PEP-CTERM sorting domain-containing protein [Rubritalea sp.]
MQPTFSLDNLTVAAVPEPSSFTMLGLGALGLISRRRR